MGSLVYTLWSQRGIFIYVGMAGRTTAISAKSKGLFGRLASHASGRRSGDQFCIYVCDRLVLPRVHNRLDEIADGTLSLDALTREYIRSELGFRFQAVADPGEACRLERHLQCGVTEMGRPLLNPRLSI